MSRPPNFSWVLEGQLAVMGYPRTKENLNFLIENGVQQLITLSPEMLPPLTSISELQWSKIDIKEFEAPTLNQIQQFIDICSECRENKKPVGIHCRMGLGRSGVMAACYLIYFLDIVPERALLKLRLLRPGSVETPKQERILLQYRDFLRSSN